MNTILYRPWQQKIIDAAKEGKKIEKYCMTTQKWNSIFVGDDYMFYLDDNEFDYRIVNSITRYMWCHGNSNQLFPRMLSEAEAKDTFHDEQTGYTQLHHKINGTATSFEV